MCDGIVLRNGGSPIVVPRVLPSKLSVRVDDKFVLRRQVTVGDLGLLSGHAYPGSSDPIGVSRSHFGPTGLHPIVLASADELVRLGRGSAASRARLGGSSPLSDLPRLGGPALVEEAVFRRVLLYQVLAQMGLW